MYIHKYYREKESCFENIILEYFTIDLLILSFEELTSEAIFNCPVDREKCIF